MNVSVQKLTSNFKKAYRHLRQVFQLVWQASAVGTLWLAGMAAVGGMVPPAIAWVKKLMIDEIVGLVTDEVEPWDGVMALVPFLSLIIFLLALSNVVMQGRLLAEKNLRSRLRLHIHRLIIEKALTLDLSHFENADYYNKLQNARNEADFRVADIVVQTFKLIQSIITFTSFAILLIRFNPLLILILIGATLPSFGMQQRYGQLTFRLLSGQAPERREMKYYERLLTVDQNAKEIKLFGLGQTLLRRYIKWFWKLFREDMQLAQRRSVVSVLWGMLGLVGYFFAIAWIIFRAIAQTITFGDAVLNLEVFEQSHYLGQAILNILLKLYENNLFVTNVFEFMKLESQHPAPTNALDLPVSINHAIEFENLSFKYPGQEDWTLRNINLKLHPGEKMALVGLNGAGKTTLVKILAGLYEPTEGRILVDGVELGQYDLHQWHKKIGVIFQDFVHYQFTAAENIGFGQIEYLDDQERIVAAAQRGGAHEVLENLPNGYATRLGKWFEDGFQLSIGEWQKVALSRAFMREAELLILDEPTASLDAQHEFQIFEQFRELTAGKMAVLISHRFSTVRMADRIAVIEKGSITELGNHSALMANGGTYAQLFNLQAQGYR